VKGQCPRPLDEGDLTQSPSQEARIVITTKTYVKTFAYIFGLYSAASLRVCFSAFQLHLKLTIFFTENIMGSSTILAIALGSIAALLAVFYVKNGMDQAELNRAVEIAQHKKTIRRFQNTLKGFPPQYLIPLFKQFLLQETLKELQIILHLEPHNTEIQRERETVHQQLEQLQQTPSSNPVRPIQSLEETNDIRNTTAVILKYIEELYENRQIDKSNAQQLCSHLQKVIGQSGFDFYLFKADMSEKDKKYQLALSLYHRAKQELLQHQSLDPQHVLQQQIEHKIKMLTVLSENQASNDSVNTLDEAVNDLIAKENEKWTKKYF
jgi:hypothetical protein